MITIEADGHQTKDDDTIEGNWYKITTPKWTARVLLVDHQAPKVERTHGHTNLSDTQLGDLATEAEQAIWEMNA